MFADLFQIMVHRRRDLHHDASSGRPGDALWKTHGTGHLFSFVDFPSRVKHFLINFEIEMNRISSTSNFTIETYLMSYTNISIYIIYINIINIISNFLSTTGTSVVSKPRMRADRGQTTSDRRRMGRVGLLERVFEDLRGRGLDRGA